MKYMEALCAPPSATYLPDITPTGVGCPVMCYRLQLDNLEKIECNEYIEGCMRLELASKSNHLLHEFHYCYNVFLVDPKM